MKTIAVFTPTYNRAYCLQELYESLVKQTSQDFEWLIIDDGSTDTTKALVFEWLKEQGGLEEMERRNRRKAQSLYAAIDGSGFYQNPVQFESRSLMNVPFILADSSLDAEFVRQAEAAGLSSLKGHRSVGGMRASIYNAMPEAGIEALVSFMAEFERNSA